jgi:hypothetical protein
MRRSHPHVRHIAERNPFSTNILQTLEAVRIAHWVAQLSVTLDMGRAVAV